MTRLKLKKLEAPHVVSYKLIALGVFFGNHLKNVMKFLLRLLRRVANRMTAVNGRNIGNKASVVVRSANDMIIEKRFHNGNLAHMPIRETLI